MQLLQGVKIIDFTRLLPGPLATNMLAQMGATVIKIESPKRKDYARTSGSQIDGASILFHQLNHHKTILNIDYETADGKAQVVELIKKADVLVEQFRPGAMAAWGLDYEQIKKINPKVVYASLTGYGQDSPLSKAAGHDFNYLAYAGLMSLLKDDNGKPIVPGFQLADIGGGSYMAVMAIQAALLQKERTGKGAYLDIAMADGVLPMLAVPFALQQGGLDHRLVNFIDGKTVVNYAAYECADGKWLSVAALEVKFWNRICELVEKPNWKRQNIFELSNQVFKKDKVIALFKTKTQQEWMQLFDENTCVAPILELEDLQELAYHQSRGNFEVFKTKNGKSLTGIGLPFKAQ